jgi:hypothetical protein
MNDTLKNLTKLRIAGLLSENAREEAEKMIQGIPVPKSQVNSEA